MGIGAGVVALTIGGGATWLQLRPDRLADRPEPATTTVSSPAVRSIPPVSPDQMAALDSLDKQAISRLDPAIAGIGRRYLAEHPNEADPQLLIDLLPAPASDPIEAAASTMAAEFLAGNTVTVAGWVLSASEARAAAIVAYVCDGDDAC